MIQTSQSQDIVQGYTRLRDKQTREVKNMLVQSEQARYLLAEKRGCTSVHSQGL